MTDNTDQGPSSLFDNVFSDVLIEVSLVLKDGRKISTKVSEDLWWSILSNTSKSIDRKEAELLELLMEGVVTPHDDLWS